MRVTRGDVVVAVGGVGHVSTLTGAARLVVPSTIATAGAAGTTSSSSAPASQGSGGSSGSAPVDAVFPSVTGHVQRLLVTTGERVVAGQSVAVIADDGAMAASVLQARSDLQSARLELAQKQVQDPVRGVPPTPQELNAGRVAVQAAGAKLQRVLAGSPQADLAAARLDVAKATAELGTARAGHPDAVAAAELAVATARQRLALVTGSPSSVDVAVAQLELAKATLDQETLLRPSAAPSPSAVQAADLAIDLAQQHLLDAQAAGVAADLAAARAELAKAHSEKDVLVAATPTPSAAARSAAQLAVDAARRRLDDLLRPPAATVSAARQELARSRADLAVARAAGGGRQIAALKASVAAARGKLSQLLAPPARDVTSAARLDVRKAQADLAVLNQRGAPASAIDLAIARLKVDVGAGRLALAQALTGQLTVVARASGTVTSVLTVPGAAVDPVTPIARVQDLDHLVVTLDLSEFDVSRTRVGDPALVSADALGGREFGGQVLDVALSGADNGGIVSFPVLIGLRSHTGLRPGMSVSSRIIVRRRRAVLRIPVGAVDASGDAPTVMVRNRSGALVQRRVRVGLAGATYVEVRSGLTEGDRILVPSGGGGG